MPEAPGLILGQNMLSTLRTSQVIPGEGWYDTEELSHHSFPVHSLY